MVLASLALTLVALIGTTAALEESPKGASPTEYEDHAPIHIASDGGLLLPDAVSGNGVRGGSGTPEDPFIISGWRIQARNTAAVIIERVNAHVLVKDVLIEGGGSSLGIYVGGSSNVTFQDVNATKWNGPTVGVRNSHVAFVRGDYSAPTARSLDADVFRVRSSAVEWEGTRVSGGRTGILAFNSDLTVSNATVRVASYGVQTINDPDSAFPPGARALTIENSTFRGPPPERVGESNRANYQGYGVVLSNTHYTEQCFRNNTFRSLITGLMLDFYWDSDRIPPLIRITGNAFIGNTEGLDLGWPSMEGEDVRVTGNVFGRNYFGLSALDSHAVVTGNTFQENNDGVLFTGLSGVEEGERRSYNLTLERNAFSTNARGAVWGQISTASHFGLVHAPHNWWGHADGPAVGDFGDPDQRDAVPPEVRFEPWLREPPRGVPSLPPEFADVPRPSAGPIPLYARFAHLIPAAGAAWSTLLTAGVAAAARQPRGGKDERPR